MINWVYTIGMTSTTTRDDAVEVLKALTAEHGHEPYFIKADVIYNDGFFCVDMTVEGSSWRARENKKQVPPQINKVPVCVLVYG